ncbi:MAG: M56 family metallopeptidase, partial [Aequorivita sp.]|nr:M56 family metallopeptidase [Aequorivita sp.]
FHEETHARQKHSLDIVFATLLQIVFWFNPLFYFIKKSIKLNHEFLADRAVLKTGAKISEYQKILLAFSSNAATPSLAHSLNYSSIKKRFTLMKTHTSQRAIWLRSLLILPLFSILIYGFSTTHVINELKGEANNSSEVSEVLEITIDGNENIYIDNEEIPLEIFDEKITEKNYERTSISTSSKISVSFGQHIIIKLLEKNLTDGLSFCVTADGNTIPENYSGKILEPLHNYNKSKNKKVTKTEIAEYNKLAKKYNAVAIENRKIPLEDLKILETIYRKMTDEQKVNAEPFPECLPPSPPKPPKAPEAPKVKEGEKSDIPPPPPAPKIAKAPSAENGNLYMVPQAPPAPNPDPVEYVKELGKRGATFYIGPHKYSTDEAIELVQKSKEATIDVSKYPIVHLGGC